MVGSALQLKSASPQIRKLKWKEHMGRDEGRDERSQVGVCYWREAKCSITCFLSPSVKSGLVAFNLS